MLAHGDDDDDDGRHGKRGVCSTTAKLALKACRAEVSDDLLIASAICLNRSDRDERRDCEQTAREENSEFLELCMEQFHARMEVCDLVGEGPYDPDFDPEKFDFDQGGNPWFPLALDNRWVYESEVEDGTDTITVTVLNNGAGNFATKQIGITEDSEDSEDSDGVTCLVVNDQRELDGEVIEDTDDWYA